MGYDAFISYARDDGRNRAEKLKADLEARGYQVYLDLYENEPGIEWWGRIEDAIAQSRSLLFIITERSVKSAVCQREWQTAADCKLLLLPVKVVDRRGKIIADSDIPDHIGKLHYIDTTQQWDEGVALIDGLLTRYEYLAGLQQVLQTEIDRSTATRYIEILSQSKPDAVKAKTMRRQFRIASVHERPATEALTFETFDAAWNAHPNGVLLLGDPGAGKTTTLLHQAKYLIAAYLADRNQPVPVYDRITAWNPDKNLPLDDWLVATNDLPPDMKNVMGVGRAILILDGLDELGRSRPVDPQKPEEGTYDPRQRFIARAQEMIKRGNPVLMTCRVKDYAEIGEQLVGIGAVLLQDLTNAQIDEYLGDVPTVREAVQNDADLLEICRSPLLLSLIAFGYRDAPAELQGLGNLKAGALRDAIFGQYIETSYKYEKKRRLHPDIDPDTVRDEEVMPFTLDKMLEALGHAAMINASGEREAKGLPLRLWITTTENKLEHSDFTHYLDDNAIDVFSTLACDLHILYKSDDETHSFLHLLLRDHLAFEYSIEHLQNEEIYPESGRHQSPAKALSNLGDTRAVEPLISALADSAPGVRRSATEALGELGDTRAIEPLIQALADTDRWVRQLAAFVLGRIGDICAVDPLIDTLDDADYWVREAVAEALGKLGDTRAIEPLIQALADTNVNNMASQVLWQFGELALNSLLNALHHENSIVRKSVAYVLGRIGDTRAGEPLIDALYDTDWKVRRSAADALGELGDSRAVEPLINALADDNPNVYWLASKALGQLGEPALQPLLNTLGHENSVIRMLAAEALGEIGNFRAVKPLINALADTDSWVRRSSADALGKLGDARAVEPLMNALVDTGADVRESAAKSLGRLGDVHTVPVLIELLADTEYTLASRVCDEAALALSRIGTPEALAAVEAWERNGRGHG